MPESTELIPGLPQEIALECLTRLHFSTHGVAARVCKGWRHLLQSRDFYYHRKKTGHTHKAACLIQSLLPTQIGSSQSKSVRPPKYGISIFDPVCGSWERVDMVPEYTDGLPLFCQVTSSEGKVLLLGGWDPVSYKPLSHVFVYEFATRKWRRVKDMPCTRSFFAVGEMNGKVVIAGGHDENKNALSTAWVYDVTRDEWSELSRMSQERDECEGIVVGSEFFVVSGYRTDNQGGFEDSADLETGEWRRVEGAWRATQCPRSCLGLGKGGTLMNLAECESAVRVGTCSVDLGEMTFVSGSCYQGGAQGFFIVDGQNSKWKKAAVPDEFTGFVQSGCCLEI